MKKNKKIKLFLLFIFFLLNLKSSVAVPFLNKTDTDVIVSIDDKVFTKFDLKNFFNIQKITGETKYKKLDNISYKKILDAFIDYQIQKKIMNYTTKQMTKEELDEFWSSNKFKFKTDVSLLNFCAKISVDKDFFVDYISFLQKWQEYIMGDLIREIKITDEDVYEYLEVANKNNKNFKQTEYSLYSITLNFNNIEEKQLILNSMNKIKNKATAKNFKKMLKKYSQFNSGEQELEKYMENELNQEMLENCKKLNKNQISNVSCSTGDSGYCMLFQLVDKKISKPQLTEQELVSVKNFLYMAKLEKQIHNVVLRKKGESSIILK